jgi:septin family protein
MRRLHTKVNLIPVIAKADTLTDDEVAEFKSRVSRYYPISDFHPGYLQRPVDSRGYRLSQYPYFPSAHLRK